MLFSVRTLDSSYETMNINKNLVTINLHTL